jgi:hypothetical protein
MVSSAAILKPGQEMLLNFSWTVRYNEESSYMYLLSELTSVRSVLRITTVQRVLIKLNPRKP